ncbi:pirin family protein [Microcoleus sp. D3_18a_C4]|uniref:pirin family protein n=1 Tax=Microcoleus sp. D3_18a_C4 TaxID=3055332 RepID=UPI002FD08929
MSVNFFDHLGPAVFPPGRGVDVRPHPHINLATVTYLFEGVLLHRDSVGSVQEIRQACGELDDGRARHCPLRTHA